ncbi:MAG: HD domain-containing protein [Treponema sp.]|nr:HD domain-containing protein [Treponema sp.]MCL2236886.1 HD domain-containing protein [Treponema sp.]
MEKLHFLEHSDNNEEKAVHLQKLMNSMVVVFAEIIDNRDKGIVGHLERTTKFLKILTDAMIEHKVYNSELGEFDLNSLYSASRLYEVGKIFIPEIILNKPGKLTQEEFEIMKTHAIQGERIIDRISLMTEAKVEFLHHAKLFTGYHHERWDGKGYPCGLDRLNIPLQGRIMAIVDVYNALVSERPYKTPFTPEEAVKIIMDSTGEMFDPLIADVFFEVKEQFYNA